MSHTSIKLAAEFPRPFRLTHCSGIYDLDKKGAVQSTWLSVTSCHLANKNSRLKVGTAVAGAGDIVAFGDVFLAKLKL